MTRGSRMLVVLLAVACCGRVAGAQPQPIQLSGEVELARLVDLSSQRLNLNIEYDPADLRSKVTLRLGASEGDPDRGGAGAGISDAKLWSLTNRLLAAHQLTTVRMPGDDATSVVKLNLAKGLARIEFDEAWLDGTLETPAGFIRARVAVRHRETDAMITTIKPILTTSGTIEALIENEWLLISDLRPRVMQAVELLSLIDRPYDTVVEEIELEHVRASGLAAQITQIVEKSAAVTGEWRVNGRASVTIGSGSSARPIDCSPSGRASIQRRSL